MQTWTYDICRVWGTRAYGINHDGSHPHFLGPDELDDLDSAHAHTSRSRVQDDLVRRIEVEEGIKDLNRYLDRAAEKAALQVLEREVFEHTLRAVFKITARVSIVGDVLAFLSDDGNPGCDAGGFMMNVKSRFATVGSLLERVAGSAIGDHPVLSSRVTGVQAELEDFLDHTKDVRGDVTFDCTIYYDVAIQAATGLDTALSHAQEHLTQLDFEHQRRLAVKAAHEPEKYGAPIGTKNCDEAKDLVDSLGRGRGQHNHVIYWAPPPPLDSDVDYVGRSRDLKQRCEKHPEERSRSMTTLNLPPLSYYEARNVEEALIAYFGIRDEEANPGTGKDAGQLSNNRHEISRDLPDYCWRLLQGQEILKVNTYVRYAHAYYTRGRRCPGVGLD